MKDNKYIIPSLIAVGIIMVVIGSTFAYWNWQSTNAEKTNVTFTVGSTFSCSANGGGNITNTNYLVPTDCDNETYAIKREITVNTTSQVANEIINLSMDLNIDSISPALLQTDYFMYALTQNANSCNGAISGGSFKDNYDSVNHTIPLLTDEEFIGAESKTYYLYIWLDKDETNANTMNTSFSGSITGECSDSGDVLRKVYVYLGGAGAKFKANAYKDNITSVSFVNYINIPDNATNWEIGATPSNSSDAVAWLEDDGSGNNTFALKIGAEDTMYAVNLYSAFHNMRYVTDINLSGLNTSETIGMHQMFHSVGYNATSLNIDLGNDFDTSHVNNMGLMFAYAGRSATMLNLNIGNKFNTSNVTSMYHMFDDMGKASPGFNFSLGNHFNTANVTDMSFMFTNFGRMFATWNLNLGEQFYTSNVTNMAGMFSNAGLKATNFSFNLGTHFDTSKVTQMSSMFWNVGNNSTNFYFDLGNQFNTSNVTDMAQMFANVGNNSTSFYLNLGNKFDTSNVTTMTRMFEGAGYNATSLNIDLGNNFNMSKVTSTTNMFTWFGNKTQTNYILDLSPGDFNNITQYDNMFKSVKVGKATIYVKDATAQQWIINGNSSWGTNFSASKVLIK